MVLDFRLIYPMSALVLLTVIVIFLMLYQRVKAVRTRQLSPRYFKLNSGGTEPEILTQVTHNFNNLLELPILFYTVCILAILLNKDMEAFCGLAWAYVAIRIVHSIIHITYNHVMHRLLVFAASCAVLVAMWIKLVLAI